MATISLTHLKTCNVGAEERRKFATAALSTALVTHLIVENVRLHLNAFVNVAMLQLNEASRDSGDVTLLVGECNATSTLNENKISIKNCH